MSHEYGHDDGATVIHCYWCDAAIDYRDSVERITVELPFVSVFGPVGLINCRDRHTCDFHAVRECLECCESIDRLAWSLIRD